jgi:WhiB family redox-sensing transcriptional regulator
MTTATLARPDGLSRWLLARTGQDLSWQEHALCAQADPDAFFPDKGSSPRQAKNVCQACTVRAECLSYALENDERFGVWGGLTDHERRDLKTGRTQLPAAPAPAPADSREPGVPAPARPSPPGDVIHLGEPGGTRPTRPARTTAPAAPAQPSEAELARRCQQQEPDPITRAEAIGDLLQRGRTAAQIAQRTGLSPATVSSYRALLELDQPTQQLVRTGRLPVAAAAAAVRAVRRSRTRAQLPPAAPLRNAS